MSFSISVESLNRYYKNACFISRKNYESYFIFFY